MDLPPTESHDLLAVARTRVKIGPVPDWVAPSAYNADFAPAVRARLTPLLTERQVHAELHQTFDRNATRLETMHAVQEASQWRLNFEPQTETVTLHSIAVRRGADSIEHLSLERLQFLRRETELEGLAIHGHITLLLVLEDVRPGDILETSCTIETHRRLFPELITSFFTLPVGLQIGKYHFSVQHAPGRPVKWKSSSSDLTPTITQLRDEIRCTWLAEGKAVPEPEECLPYHFLPFPWVQISDCPDWQTVAQGVLKAWDEAPVSESFSKLLDEIQKCGPELLLRVNRAIELVQDDFRYLSVNLELGGQVPAPAETVARRRYGDCKDLAFLLVRLLRALGVTARPVLVNAHWRRSIAAMLPSPNIFNDAIVEFELQNEKRWVDCTMKSQGGGALGRRVQDFGLGLPIDASSVQLVPVPVASLPTGTCEVKESYILDTAGNPSHLAVNLVLTGLWADDLRLQLASHGRDEVAKRRLQMCADRYSKATRIGQLEYRDDRDANQFVLGEVFDIEGFLLKDPRSNTCVFRFQSDATAGLLPRPSAAPRRNPFALSFPCNRVHIIEVDFQALDAIQLPPFQTNNDFFHFQPAQQRPAQILSRHLLSRHFKGSRPAAASRRSSQTGRCGLANPGAATPPAHRLRPASQTQQLRRVTRACHALRFYHCDRSSASRFRSRTGAGDCRHSRAGNRNVGRGSAFAAPCPATRERIFIRPGAPSVLLKPGRGHSRSSSRHSSQPRRFGKGAVSLAIMICALALFALGAMVRNTPSGGVVAGLLFLLMVPSVAASLVLAILALRQASRHPFRSSHEKTFAWIAIGFGILYALIIVPALALGFKYALRNAEHRRLARAGQPDWLRFEKYNFIFRSPGPPWLQRDTRVLSRSTVLAFGRPGAEFAIVAHTLEPGYVHPRDRVVELNKASMQHDLTSIHMLNEGPLNHNGVEGWQMEFTANFQGRDFYTVTWIVAENNFGYVLSTWGLSDSKDDLKSAADQMFSSFQPTK